MKSKYLINWFFAIVLLLGLLVMWLNSVMPVDAKQPQTVEICRWVPDNSGIYSECVCIPADAWFTSEYKDLVGSLGACPPVIPTPSGSSSSSGSSIEPVISQPMNVERGSLFQQVRIIFNGVNVR